jgi:hypothetical protein
MPGPGPIIPKPVVTMVFYVTTKAGQFANVTFWSASPAPASVGDVQAIADAASAIMAPLYIAAIHSSAAYAGVHAKYEDGTHIYEADSSSGTGIGTVGGTAVSDQNAAVLRKYTGLAKPRNRGRWFVSGMSSLNFASTNPDEIDSAYYASYEAIVAAFTADMTAGGSVLHARHWNRTDNVLVPISYGKVSTRVASRDDRRRHAPDFAV